MLQNKLLLNQQQLTGTFHYTIKEGKKNLSLLTGDK